MRRSLPGLLLFSQRPRQTYYLVKKNIVRSFKQLVSLDDLVLKLSSLPNDKVRVNDINAIQPGKIKIASIKDIVSVWLIGDFIHSLHVKKLWLP